MGLFKMFKHKEEKNNKLQFSPQVIKTDNVSQTLAEISKTYNISVSNLDFDILTVETFVKLDQESDFVSIDEQTIDLIKKRNLLENQFFEIKQSYELKIRKFDFSDNFELIGKLGANKTLTEAFYDVSPASILNYSEMLEHILIEELERKKIKSGMIIRFEPLESNFLSDIKELVTKIRVLGGINEDFRIHLCKGIKPIPPVKMRVIEHYKNREEEDIRFKELIYPIHKDDLILEILKPKKGKNGRNCRGKFIKVDKLRDSEIPQFKIKDDVLKREDEDRIRYISNKNGYVYIKEGVIIIKDELEINQISLRTGDVRGAENSDVKLEIKESNFLKEAIRDGMVVETTELLVKGNIGNGAKVKAKKLKIEGQTHRHSKILSFDADINIHKGSLKGKNILIHRLEGGIVEGDNIHILQAISGKVIGKKIKIDLMGSHLTLISSELIEIETLKGSENRFIIDESLVTKKWGDIEKMENRIKELEIDFRKKKEIFNDNKAIILRNKFTIDELKMGIKEKQKLKIAVPPSWFQKLKKFNEFIKKTKLLEERLKKIKEEIEIIKGELDSMQNSLFLAKIISKSGFGEFNRIEFHLIEPPIKIVYDTKPEDEYNNLFMLKDLGEMNYVIKGEKL